LESLVLWRGRRGQRKKRLEGAEGGVNSRSRRATAENFGKRDIDLKKTGRK